MAIPASAKLRAGHSSNPCVNICMKTTSSSYSIHPCPPRRTIFQPNNIIPKIPHVRCLLACQPCRVHNPHASRPSGCGSSRIKVREIEGKTSFRRIDQDGLHCGSALDGRTTSDLQHWIFYRTVSFQSRRLATIGQTGTITTREYCVCGYGALPCRKADMIKASYVLLEVTGRKTPR